MRSSSIISDDVWKEYRSFRGERGQYGTLREELSHRFKRVGSLWSRSAQAETKNFIALEGISFEVTQGECFGIIGANGAGKTTLLRILSRITPPSRGKVEITGRLASLLEVGTGMHPELTGEENIFLLGSVLGMTRAEVRSRFEEIVEFSGVGEFLHLPVKRYSSGMQVRLAFSVAMNTYAEILLLDEVMSVGDMAFRAKSANKLGEFRRNGGTLVLVSHNMHHVKNFCDRVLVLNTGKQVFLGNPVEAVEAYYSSALTRIEGPSFTNQGVIGRGGIRFLEAFFTNEEGVKVESIAAGDPLSLVVRFQQNQEHVTSPLLDVVLYDDHGVLFQATNQTAGCDLSIVGELGEVVIQFESIRSNFQRLSLAIAFWDRTMSTLYDWKRDIPVLVRGNANFAGREIIPTTWTVKSLENLD